MIENFNAHPRPQAGRGCLKYLILAPVIFIGGLFAGVMALMLAGSFLTAKAPIGEVDTIVILSGGGAERAEEAVRIYQENKNSIIMLTLSRATDSLNLYGQPPYAYFNNLYKGGVPGDNVILTRAVSESTLDESKAVLEEMQHLGLKSCVVVTDPYHTRRAEIIFKDAFQESGFRVTIRPARTHWYKAYNWFMSKRGWDATLREYAKLFAYFTGVDQ